MYLSGTEADVVNCVARLRKATKDQIRKEVGFSLGYVDFLCRYLIRKSYLKYSEGHYYLGEAGLNALATEEIKSDRNLIKEIIAEVTKGISGKLEKTVEGIKIPHEKVRVERRRAKGEEPAKRKPIEIKTDFDYPIEDESLALESNISKIGTKLEKEKSDIDKSVELLKQIRKKRRR